MWSSRGVSCSPFSLWTLHRLSLRQSASVLFREMRPYIGQCRFHSDCAHRHEPGCAIKEAVASGTISKMRYESFLRM